MKAILLATAMAVALSACATTGTIPTPTQTTLATEQAYFNAICVDAPGAPSVVTTIGLLQMNANQAKAYNTAVALCALGMPTNVGTWALDAVVVALAIQQNFPTVKINV